MKKLRFKAFSLVELLVVVTIIAIIGAIVVSLNDGYKEKTYNTKVITDLATIENSLIRYKQENTHIPSPEGNLKYFTNTGSYAHDETEAFGVHGFLTEKTIPKKYINVLPRDPRSNNYYAYGTQIVGGIFEVSGILSYKEKFESVVRGNYEGKDPLYNLIREYNGPEFVYDKSVKSFPYNPEEMILTARITSFTGDLLINDIIEDKSVIIEKQLISGDNIKLSSGSTAVIYYSDGTVSYLGDGINQLDMTLALMKYKKDNNLFTKMRIALNFGTVLTKASKMSSESNFDLYTTDIEASVRGTIFEFKKIPLQKTIVTVIRGSVIINKVNLGTIQASYRYIALVDTLKKDESLNLVNIDIFTTDNENLNGKLEEVSIDGEMHVLLKEGGSVEVPAITQNPYPPIVSACSGLPTNAIWNDVSSINQTWNGGNYTPSIIGVYNNDSSTLECRFKCVPNYNYVGGECVLGGGCPTLQHIEGSTCTSNSISCGPIANGTYTKTWNFTTNGRNSCVLSCNTGNHSEGLSCVSNSVSCGTIANGTNTKTWNFTSNGRNSCVLRCNINYVESGNSCIGETKPYTCLSKPSNTVRNSVSSYNQTWNGSSWVPGNTSTQYNTSSSNTSCMYKCDSLSNRNGSSCIKCTGGFTWDSSVKKCKKVISGNGCSSCSSDLLSEKKRIGSCTFGNRYERKCGNQICGKEKNIWNCNDFTNYNWSITIYQ